MTQLGPQPDITIELLGDHPEDVEPLARHFYNQWPKWSGSVEAQVTLFESRSNRDRLPLALVAHRAMILLGTVSLLERSVHSHSHLSPWVAALYVLPIARHAGVAMRLMTAAEEWAHRLGYGAVYIGISAAQEQYEQRGWKSVGVGHTGEDVVSVLSKSRPRPDQ
jgi:GNAT superfamily N-acetyltransferase